MEIARTVLNFLVVILEVILIFNLLIVVHELGHFLAARWRGLVVEQFAVWFGKPIWKRTYNGVVYSLGSIPFGGFVKLPQMAPMDAIEGESTTDRAALPVVSPLDKIIVALAGPMFSFGLAFIFAVVVWAVGRPVSEAETSAQDRLRHPRFPGGECCVCDDPGRAQGPAPRRRDRGSRRPPRHPVQRHERQRRLVRRAQRRREHPFQSANAATGRSRSPRSRCAPDASGGWRRKGLREVMIEPSYDQHGGGDQAQQPGG